ncbi:hypothetical protein [Marinicellulosiphila megalodicopiae]|uniref:pectate lyase family protein n=1 Tax=Marinicellulosiphila megalodicopiae TaxID=2724896 RepID=UPI003BB20DDB
MKIKSLLTSCLILVLFASSCTDQTDDKKDVTSTDTLDVGMGDNTKTTTQTSDLTDTHTETKTDIAFLSNIKLDELNYQACENIEIESFHAGFEGSGALNATNAVGSGIGWNFYSSKADSEATLTIRYANNGGTSRTAVATGVSHIIEFPDTGAWVNWVEIEVSVSIVEGTQQFELISDNINGLSNIDYITLGSDRAMLMAQSSTGVCEAQPVDTQTQTEVDNTDTQTSTQTSTDTNTDTEIQIERVSWDKGLIGYATLDSGTTGGAGGEIKIASTGDQLQGFINEAADNNVPVIVLLDGTVTPANNSGLLTVLIKDTANVSIVGVDDRGVFDGVGIRIYKSNNVIVQNLTISNVPAPNDAIDIEGKDETTHHIWIDHNELFATFNFENESEKDLHDGLLDSKSGAHHITVSYNYFHDSWGATLHGHDDGDSASNKERKITFHHNRFENINSRAPLVRFGEGHVFNNYYNQIKSSGINSRMGAVLRVENNYFENVQNPIVSWDSDTVGFWEVSGNYFADSVTWSNETDAQRLNGGPNVVTTGNVTIDYSYVLDAVEDVKLNVLKHSGVNAIDSNYVYDL